MSNDDEINRMAAKITETRSKIAAEQRDKERVEAARDSKHREELLSLCRAFYRWASSAAQIKPRRIGKPWQRGWLLATASDKDTGYSHHLCVTTTGRLVLVHGGFRSYESAEGHIQNFNVEDIKEQVATYVVESGVPFRSE